MVRLSLEGAVIGTVDWGEVEANEALLCKHVHPVEEARVQAMNLALMHIVDWREAQEEDAVLAMCIKWLKTCKDTPKEKWDAQLKKCLGELADMDEGCVLFHIHNSLTLSKDLLYLSMTPKGELEGVLVFLVPPSQHTTALNSIHHAVHSRGQFQRPLCVP